MLVFHTTRINTVTISLTLACTFSLAVVAAVGVTPVELKWHGEDFCMTDYHAFSFRFMLSRFISVPSLFLPETPGR